MTLGQLIAECESRSGLHDPSYYPQWRRFINGAIREFARTRPWDGLEDTVDLVTDGTKYLYAPAYVDTIVGLFDLDTPGEITRDGPLERLTPTIEAYDTLGRPLVYDLKGEVATVRDPSGYCWFKSSHASDGDLLSVAGLVHNSGASGTALERTIQTLSVACAGVSPVTLTTLFAKIFSIARATEANGDLTFYDAAATDAWVSHLGRNQTTARFKRLQLAYVPAAGTRLRMKFRYTVPFLVEDAEAPHPAVRSDYVINQTLATHWAEQEQFQKAQFMEGKASQTLEREANKDANFDEPNSRLIPFVPHDPTSYE